MSRLSLAYGDELGQVKHVEFDMKRKRQVTEEKLPTSLIRTWSDETVDRTRAVQAMTLIQDTSLLVSARANHQVTVRDASNISSPVQCFNDLFDDNCIGIYASSSFFMLATEKGSIIRQSWQISNETVECIGTKQVDNLASSLSHLCVSPSSQLFAVAGDSQDRDIAIYDLNQSKPSWESKNVKHDALDLRVPVAVGCLAWCGNDHQVMVGTKHKQVRMYDTRTQRRPVLDLTWGERPLKSMLVDDNLVIFSDTTGNVTAMDLRQPASLQVQSTAMQAAARKVHPLWRLPVRAGAVTCMTIGKVMEKSWLATAGLDRHVMLYDMKNGTKMDSIYCRSRATSLLTLPLHSKVEEEDENVDALMAKLPRVKSKNQNKKRKSK